ncbi:MAG: nickel pincer cofactor biosynthesis protein LarC [Defluviitaleaceae bacterium]|nr:nickel pincer cofactor biosynthesis protein LarC [Defluviitaleaceae bacterium]
MKTLYLECGMGAAGDMLMAALLALHKNPEDFLKRLNAVGIQGVTVTAKPSIKCGITGTHVSVKVNGQEEHSHDHHGHDHHEHSHAHDPHSHHDHAHGHEHHHEAHSHDHAHDHTAHQHNSFAHIEHLIGHLHISECAKQNAVAVYQLIAEAESHAHGAPISQIHFHEVGEMDAIADIVGVCMLMEELAPEKILASPVNVGNGYVRCSHGILPVPAPATAFILQHIPMYSDQTKGELCTPTGAALLKHFAGEFCKMPMISVDKIGYGMGTKDFDKANCVRAFMGETAEADYNSDEVIELTCNLDDMTPEALSFAHQCLGDAGALDVCITPIVMKKGRAGYALTCMCLAQDREKMCRLIFKHTTTLGMREYTSRRYTLKREFGIIQTPFGDVRTKTAHGFGIKRFKPEHDDIAAIAKKHELSIRDVLEEINHE